MKRLFFILIMAILMTSACDTTKQSSSQKTVAQQSTYTSPIVYTTKDPIKALPADSIPTSYSIKGVAMAPADFAPMMGRWMSTFDEKEVVHFTPGRYSSYYNGEKIVEEKMVYYHVCPDNCEGAAELNKPCFVLASEYGQMCFAILKHTDEELELTMLGQDNANLTYVRQWLIDN